jgi:hypothetical protein
MCEVSKIDRATSGKSKPLIMVPGFIFVAVALMVLSGRKLMSQQEGLSMLPSGPGLNPRIESVTTTEPWGSSCDVKMDMKKNMSVMGESMESMTNHMCITPRRPEQSGDAERAKAVVDQVRLSIEKYKDYKMAIKDGYIQANPDVDQPQFHFTSEANAKLADTTFDPTRPTSLLYYHSPTQKYKLEGVMFTADNSATEDDLNSRLPLSIVRWHKHTNFCAAPKNKVNEYFGDHPKFGMFGSIHTRETCNAEGGIFLPVVFTWMVHVFPYEKDPKGQFSMDDDISHAR